MRLIAICLAAQGRELVLDDGSKSVTGLFKEPVTQVVSITAEGLAGDTICNAQYHGGPDQAVYVYGKSDYDWWETQLGRTLAPGTFGENLVVDSYSTQKARVGDRLEFGNEVVLEVTAPRAPCDKFAKRMGDTEFATKFREAGRLGVYCRVVKSGRLSVGNPVILHSAPQAACTTNELLQIVYSPVSDEESIKKMLTQPIAERMRIYLEKKLQENRPKN